MKLSIECSKVIVNLASSISSLVTNYPDKASNIHAFFNKEYERLKGLNLSNQYDLALIQSLGDVLKTPDHTFESISELVNSIETNTSEMVIKQISEVVGKRKEGWTDREILNRIDELITSKPDNVVPMVDETLKLCTSLIEKWVGKLSYDYSPFNQNTQYIHSKEIRVPI